MTEAIDPQDLDVPTETDDEFEISRARRYLLAAGLGPAFSIPILILSAALLAEQLQLTVKMLANGRPLPEVSVWFYALALGKATWFEMLISSGVSYLILYALLRRSATVGWSGVLFAVWMAAIFTLDLVFLCFIAVGIAAPFFSSNVIVEMPGA